MPTRRGIRTICLGFESREQYDACVDDAAMFRDFVEARSREHPELFPDAIEAGFSLHSRRVSVKLNIVTRRIKLKASGETYLIRPSFVMPYMAAFARDVEAPLLLRRFGVPFEAFVYLYGRDHMFWYRLCAALGRCSIVGTTVKSSACLPKHAVADEKHTWLKGQKAYVATTAAAGCILGAEVVTSASAPALTGAYGVFASEARDVDPEYAPKTVCIDPWKPTRKAWKKLFPAILVVLCFLHSVLKLMKSRPLGSQVRERLIGRAWHAYSARTKAQFSQRIRRLHEWAMPRLPPNGTLRDAVSSLWHKRDLFKPAYDFDAAYRTTNQVDRLMDHQDRSLYAMRYFHGTAESATMTTRSAALLWNFHPYGMRARPHAAWTASPFTELNGFAYDTNWLENLLIASSMGGWRRPAPTR